MNPTILLRLSALRMKPATMQEILAIVSAIETDHQTIVKTLQDKIAEFESKAAKAKSDGAERTRKWRHERDHRDVTVTSPDTSLNTSTVTLPPSQEISPTPPKELSSLLTTSISNSSLKNRELYDTRASNFAVFWKLYPNKIGKGDAVRKFDAACRNGVEFSVIMEGLKRYVAKTDDRPWCNPATWLHQTRWEDQPAPTNGHAHTPRPGSLEDRRERTHNAYQRLSDYAENGPDVAPGCSDSGQEASPQLRLIEPSRP